MEFKEIGRVPLTETKDLVVSKRSDGKYTIAQQIQVEDKENPNPIGIFLKNTAVLTHEDMLDLYSLLSTIV